MILTALVHMNAGYVNFIVFYLILFMVGGMYTLATLNERPFTAKLTVSFIIFIFTIILNIFICIIMRIFTIDPTMELMNKIDITQDMVRLYYVHIFVLVFQSILSIWATFSLFKEVALYSKAQGEIK